MNTWAVSNRVSMNHDRLTELRNACFEETRDPLAPLTRSQLRKCLEKTSISYSPDGEFVLDLFTMWDVSVEDQVEQVPFLLGLCPLACEESETLTSFLRFALGLLDVENTGFIIEPDLLLALKSLNTTVSLMGDMGLSDNRIHTMVNEVVLSTSLIDKESTRQILSINDVVSVLVFDPRLQRVLSQEESYNHRVSNVSEEKVNDLQNGTSLRVALDDCDSSYEDLLALRSPSANSEETWEGEHPGFPRFTQIENEKAATTASTRNIEEDASCMMVSLGVVCLPMLLVL